MSRKKSCWSWKAEQEKKELCWMCDKESYTYLDKNYREKRLLEDSDSYYVVVPKDSHVDGHVLIVLKRHCPTLMDATDGELKTLSEAVSKWGNILRRAENCDRVYFLCLNDEGHLHYHLIPVRDKGKPYSGHALQWLGDLEKKTAKTPFDKCVPSDKKARAVHIFNVVHHLRKFSV